MHIPKLHVQVKTVADYRRSPASIETITPASTLRPQLDRNGLPSPLPPETSNILRLAGQGLAGVVIFAVGPGIIDAGRQLPAPAHHPLAFQP
ncbi:MAG: hypothetical protein QX199_18600 [Methylococcaceae bacterium]